MTVDRRMRFREHRWGDSSDADFTGPARRARPGEHFELARLCVPLFYTRLDIQWRAEVGEFTVAATLDAEESGRVGQRVQHVLPPNTVPTCRLEIYDRSLLSAFNPVTERFELAHHETLYARRLIIAAVQKLALASAAAPVVLGARLERFLPDHPVGPRWTSRDTVACSYGVAPGECEPSPLLTVSDYRERPQWMVDRAALGRWAAIIAEWPADAGSDLLLDYFSMGTIDLARDHRKAFISWAIMFELMLGAGVRSNLSERMCRRAAHLASENDRAAFDEARAWYRMRGKLLHEGREPTPAEAVAFGLYMKRLLANFLAGLDCIPDVATLRRTLDTRSLTTIEDFASRARQWSDDLRVSSSLT